ncbi:MAG: VCBS repeat-containing protein [Planctomycetales bacterium]|nr:VCBS repeat-containing protein [Planctomycetales bacterium]
MKRSLQRSKLEQLESRRVLASYSLAPPEPITSYDGNVVLIRPADLDNDGDEDIVFFDAVDGSIHVIENISYGASFGKPLLLGIVPDASEFAQFEIVDMDGDQDLDIVAARTSLVVFENQTKGDIKFARVEHAFAERTTILNFRVADWDGDGDQDVIADHSSAFSPFSFSVYLRTDQVYERWDIPPRDSCTWCFRCRRH